MLSSDHRRKLKRYSQADSCIITHSSSKKQEDDELLNDALCEFSFRKSMTVCSHNHRLEFISYNKGNFLVSVELC